MILFLTMKISRLLEFHQLHINKDCLPNNLGDSYLLEQNEIYRKIRKSALTNGFTYTLEFNSAYIALGLSQLNTILQTKKIPYSDNLTILTEIEKMRPQTITWDEISDNLKRNYVFHESCHCVSKTISDQIFLTETDQPSQVLRLLIEESFSNTCELLANKDVDQSAHRIFFELNSYIYISEDRQHLNELIKDFGFEFSFQWILFSYLYSNFLYEQMNDNDFNRILKYLIPQQTELIKLKQDSKKIKKLRAILKIAFDLNLRFRENTTGFFLKMLGFKKIEKSHTKIDFMSILEKDSRYLKFINALIQTIN